MKSSSAKAVKVSARVTSKRCLFRLKTSNESAEIYKSFQPRTAQIIRIVFLSFVLFIYFVTKSFYDTDHKRKTIQISKRLRQRIRHRSSRGSIARRTQFAAASAARTLCRTIFGNIF